MRNNFFAIIWVVGFFLFTPFLAQAANDADEKNVAIEFVNSLGKKALAVISGQGSKQEKNHELESLFSQSVDIDWIAKFALGRYYRSASDDQKKQFMMNYRSFIIAHYTSNFAEFTDVNYQVTKASVADDGGYVVTMRIKRPEAEDIIVDYSVKKDATNALKVYDITVEGISMITTQRSEFNSVIQQNGLDYLISQLAARAQREKKS